MKKILLIFTILLSGIVNAQSYDFSCGTSIPEGWNLIENAEGDIGVIISKSLDCGTYYIQEVNDDYELFFRASLESLNAELAVAEDNIDAALEITGPLKATLDQAQVDFQADPTNMALQTAFVEAAAAYSAAQISTGILDLIAIQDGINYRINNVGGGFGGDSIETGMSYADLTDQAICN